MLSRSCLVIAVCILFALSFVHAGERIYGGIQAGATQFPFMVNLYDPDVGFFCGGSLISPYYVLTAAHCTKGQVLANLYVNGGTSNAYGNDEGELIKASAYYNHPNYDSVNTYRDVAVIKLSKPYTKASGARTIALPVTDPAVGTVMTVAGWGGTETAYYSDPLLYTTSPIISTTKCNSFGYDVDSTQICCYNTGGRDSCQGDSGGPLFKGQKTEATVYGIVSYGIGCGTHPGVYTRVSTYKDWIVSKTVHTVSTACSNCAVSTTWKQLCQHIGGTFALTSTAYTCKNVDVKKTRKVNYSWNNCNLTKEKDLCGKIGLFSCVNGVAKCSRL